MKSTLLLILFEILFWCHTIYGDVNPANSLVISNVIRHRRHGIQTLSNDENYRQDEEHQINNGMTNERHNKLSQHSPGNEGHDKITLRDGGSGVLNNTKLGSKIKSRITKMTGNSNQNNESNFGIAKIRDVRSSNRDHIHGRRDSANDENHGNHENRGNRGNDENHENRWNDENRGMLGASGGLSGGLGGNIGGASAGTQFGIKFNGGIGSH